MSRLHLIYVARIQVVFTCIPCRCLRVSCIGDKIVVTATMSCTCIYLYPRVEHCLELVFGTCIWCKCDLRRLSMLVLSLLSCLTVFIHCVYRECRILYLLLSK